MKNRMQGSATIAILGVIGVLIALFAFAYIGAHNKANRLEQTIKAEFTNNENILSNYEKKVREAAQVPGMATADIVAIAKAAISGRYGENGSQAAVQMITEQNPTANPALYTELQQIIKAGRDEFKVHQTRLIDAKRIYETELGSAVTGTMMGIAGFPKINLADYKIVSTARAETAFKTGQEESIQLRPAGQ